MKVTIGEDGLKKTWQAEFPKTTKCCRCGGESRVGFVAHEGMDTYEGTQKHVCNLHPNEGRGGYWLHDCCSVAVYFCRECLDATAISNQG